MLPKIKTITIAFFAITLFGIIGNTKAQTPINDIKFIGYSISNHEVLKYYRMHNAIRGKRTFWKFVFQFVLTEGNPKTMGLVCYAVNKPKEVIDDTKNLMIANTVKIDYDPTIPIANATSPIMLGNLELTRKQLQTLIGKRRNPIDFNSLYIKPQRDSTTQQLFYKVSSDANTIYAKADSVDLNPCPPGQPY